ncbi:MAG: hypothetical protein HY537_15875 [Deltaproteobacteria bacterium]|nr:hypothetical protein [Deltaproteobacteria bacterium]
MTKWLLIICAVLLSLLGCEIILRSVLRTQYRFIYWNQAHTQKPQTKSLQQFTGEDPATAAVDSAPFSRFVMRPNQKISGWSFTKQNFSANADILVEINELGYRNEPFDTMKDSKTLRLFALGGSTTFGYQRNFQAWTWQLEALFRSDPELSKRVSKNRGSERWGVLVLKLR